MSFSNLFACVVAVVGGTGVLGARHQVALRKDQEHLASVRDNVNELRRLDEKKDRREVLRTELVAQPVPLAQTPDPRLYQRVSLTGRYDGADLLIAVAAQVLHEEVDQPSVALEHG